MRLRALITTIVIAGLGGTGLTAGIIAGRSDEVHVKRVVDGDTIVVESKRGDERVRIIGIDTPELKGSECYAKPAKSFAARQLGDRWVTLKRDPAVPDVDKYGRSLRYVEVGGDDYGEQAIGAGMAEEYTVQPYQRQAKYRAFELRAKKTNTGLWGACRG